MAHNPHWAGLLLGLTLIAACGGQTETPAASAAAVMPAAADSLGDSAAGRPAADSIARRDSLVRAGETDVMRETFAYDGGSRDPFVSLINSEQAGPEFVDLTLVAIVQDLRYGRNSVAVVRDRNADKRYSVRVGDRIGRMRVAQIRQRDVVFTVEDLGFERQETLSLPEREEFTQ